MKAEVVRQGLFDLQVCVPAKWNDEEITNFANSVVPCGTTAGWIMRTDEALLNGDPVRCPCQERDGCVHVTFDA